MQRSMASAGLIGLVFLFFALVSYLTGARMYFLLNLVLVLPLFAIVAWRLVQVWAERRRGLAGSRLHIRLVVLFSLVAVIPTIIVAVFSYLLFSFGVQAWFREDQRE